MKSILTKIKSLIKRGYISRVSTNTSFYQIMQVSYLGKTGDAEYISPYGLYSNCPTKIPVIIWNLQGYENNRAAMPFSEDDRFKDLAVGEVKVGSPVSGSYVYFKADGKIEIKSNGDLDINITGNANLTVSGDVNLNANDVNITATSSVSIDSPSTSLGTGGNPIARNGDQIKVNVGGTDYFGTITGGGNNTSI